MALYTLTLRDGSTLDVEAPEGASREDLARAASQQARRQQYEGTPYGDRLAAREGRIRAAQEDVAAKRAAYEAMFDEPDESGFIGDLVGGFGAGVVGIGETAALGAATLLDEEKELAARERIQGLADRVRPDRGDEDDLTYKIGQTFGSIAGFIGAGAAVTAGAGALGAGAGAAGIAGLLGASALGVGAGAGEASERARAAGATQEERNRAARLGAVVGSTEALPLRRVLGKLTGDLGGEVVQGMRQRVVSALRTGGEEAAQEAAAGIAQNLIERGYNIDQAVLEGAGEAAALGGGAGATIQVLVDALVGRRSRGATTPEEPEQGELFEGEDLGQAPTRVMGDQREMFPEEDLGRAPERPDDRQLNLFDQRPERAPEPEQRDMIRELEQATIPEEEARAQAAAREREALRAAGRGDEAAFEQPDLFALQQEQERRRVGEQPATPERPAEGTPQEPATVRERDLVDLAQQREQTAREDADIADQLAAIEAEEAAQQQQAQALRAESDIETISGQEDTRRRKATEATRTKILQDTIEKTPSRNYNRVGRAFSDALAAQGIADTAPTQAELQSIERAVNVQRAERPEPEATPTVTSPPEATQLEEMEARIPERPAQREPEQLGMEGIRRRVQQAPTQASEPAAAREVVTRAMLDEMGIAPQSPVRRRLLGKDLNDPTTRKIITSFANQPRTSQAAELGISRRLEGVPEEQPDLFAPRRGGRRPTAATPTTATPTPLATEPAVPSRPTEQGRPAAEAQETPDASTPVTERAGASVPSRGRGVGGGGRGAGRGAGAPEPTTPRSRRLGARDEATPRPAAAAGAQRTPLEGATQRGVLPTLPRRPVIDRQTLKPVPEERAGPTSRALAPREKISPTDKPKVSTEQVTKQLKDRYEANVSQAARQFVKNLDMSITSPLTVADKTAILKVLNTKSTKANKATIGALKKYLGNYPDPALGLQDAIDDVVTGRGRFKSTPDMPPGETAFLGGDGEKGTIPGYGKKTAQAVLDWASKNMSEATKRWIAGKTVESKNAMQAVEAFESTDLVAKRRELEKAFEGGFDPTNDADNKRLAEVLEKLGIDETDPMVRGLMASGSLFNMVVPASRIPLSNVVVGMLTKGDLGAALRTLAATSNDPEVAAVASKLAKMVGDTKVELAGTLRAPDGSEVAGVFDTDTNTIALSTKFGLNTHVLLHEMAHAATVATLAKKGHPLTRKLQKIFDETKDHMPTAYGFTDLNEFVAEAFSNPEFQRMLSGLRVGGDPLTPFAKFKAAISNFLRTLIGKPVKPTESALDQATGIIDNILAPAPSNIGTGEFFMLSPRDAGKRAADMLKDIVDSTPPATKQFAQEHADQVIDFVKGDAAAKAKQFLLYSLPMISVVNTAKKAGIKGADTLFDLMERQRGAMNKSDQEVEGTLKSVSNWARANKDKVKTLDTVVYTSTIEQVDPSKPASAYKDDPEKLKAWKSMQADWRALSATGGDKIYAQMRDSYKKQYLKMRDVIFGKLDDTKELSAESRDKLKKQVYARLFETGTIEPYFPLTRSGDYWLSYTAADGEFYVEAFQSRNARERAMKDLKADTGVKNVEPFVNISNVNYARAPEGSFVKETLRTLDANGVDPKVKEELMRLFVETLPETSFAKALQRRKGTKGYEEDAIDAFKTKAFDLGRQVERLRFSSKIRELEASLVDDNRDVLTEENKYILDEINARAEFARNPPKDALAQNLNRGAFLFTLGFNVSSALVNTSQLPMVVYPMLAGRHGYGAAGRAIRNATKLFTSSGFNRKSDMIAPSGDEKSVKVRAMPSIDNYFELDANGDYVIRKDIELDPEMRAEVEEIKPLMQLMAERGHLNRSLIADTLGLDASGRKRSAVDYVSSVGATFFHNAEVFNRQVTAMTAYQLELERLKTAEPTLSTTERQEKAAEQALYDSQMMNGGSVLETAPRISQQGVGRVALMYKTYGIQMYYTLLKTARDGVDAHFAGDKEMRNVALRQLGGVVGSTFVLAGAVGLPFAREIMQLIDLLFFDEEEDDVETVVRKAIGEGAYKGPLTALLGVDLSSRIGLSGLILQANRFNSDPSPEESLLYYAGGPAWSTISSIIRGIDNMKQGEIERGFEAMMPSGLRNAYQAVFRFPRDEGILTRRGDPIMDDLSFGELAAKAIGFAPAEYTRAQEMNQQTKGIDRAVNSKRTKLLRQYYVATRMGDYDERNSVMKKIRAFNNRHRTARIDGDSLRRSMRQHMETSATMYNGVTLSPNMRRVLEESRNEWDQGFQLF